MLVKLLQSLARTAGVSIRQLRSSHDDLAARVCSRIPSGRATMGDHPADAGAGGHGDTLLGHAPESGDPVTLGPDELRTGFYIEGAVPEQQTALCMNLMAQWARAGAGFCYVHPDTFATLDVLAALPDDRLDDVVWLNLRPRQLPERLAVDTDHQLAVGPIAAAPDGVARDACTTDPAAARVGDWLDVLAHDGGHDDWNLGHVLAAVLDRAIAADMRLTDLTSALTAATLDAVYTEDAGVDVLREQFADRPGDDWTAGIRRAERLNAEVYTDAEHLLADATLTGEAVSPLRGPASCSLPARVADDAIILVTGDLPAPDATGFGPQMRRLATRLLATLVVRRVWEGVQTMAAATRDGDTSIYPVVLDDVTRLFAHDPRLFTELLNHGTDTDTPLALVCSGRTPKRFGKEVEAGVMHSVPIRFWFEEGASPETARALRADTDVMERAFAAEQEGAIAPPPTCWLDRTAYGMVSLDELGGFEQVAPLGPPEPVQSQAVVSEVIERSRERHGTPHPLTKVDM